MKKVIKNLEKQFEALEKIVQDREDKVDNMSAKWQESEKCEEWMDKTDDINTQASELFSLIESLKELL